MIEQRCHLPVAQQGLSSPLRRLDIAHDFPGLRVRRRDSPTYRTTVHYFNAFMTLLSPTLCLISAISPTLRMASWSG